MNCEKSNGFVKAMSKLPETAAASESGIVLAVGISWEMRSWHEGGVRAGAGHPPVRMTKKLSCFPVFK